MKNRLQQSEEMVQKLEVAITEAIAKVEKENNYKFMSFEIDWLLLNHIIGHQMGYIKQKFDK